MIKNRQTVKLFLIAGLLITLVFPCLVLGEELSQTEKVGLIRKAGENDYSIEKKFSNKVEIIFFYGEGCFHCTKEEKFLKELEKKYPEIKIRHYEIYFNSENQKIFQEFVKKYNVPQLAVPLTIIKDKYFLGYQSDETTGKEIESYLLTILREEKQKEKIEEIKIPIFGKVDISKMSLPFLTVVLGALDGLNPCAMWVLLFLIALLINTRSRKRMWLIGGTFILVSGVVYYLILAAWLNLFLFISYVNLTRILIGVFALGFGLWQLKEFITYNPGVCRVLGLKPNGFKGKIESGLKNRAEKLVTSSLTLAMISGVIILALGVNLIEFFCSAGLPAIYTRILALNPLSNLSYYLYLLLYTFIFLLDDLIIFSLAVITLSKIGFTAKYNYWATLIGGLLIFALGLLLIFRPELLMFAG